MLHPPCQLHDIKSPACVPLTGDQDRRMTSSWKPIVPVRLISCPAVSASFRSRQDTYELCCPLRSSGHVLVVTISSRLLWLEQGLGKDCTGTIPEPVSLWYKTCSFVRMACNSLTPACMSICDVLAVLSMCKDSFEAGEDDYLVMMVNI